MKMVEHHIDLYGPGCDGRFARPDAVGGVLSRIGPMAIQTVRMSVLHTSRKVGRPMKELKAAWDVRHGGQKAGPDGSTRLLFQAPTLEQSAPSLFSQGVLWDEGPKPQDTAFDLIGAVIADIRHEKRESERYDTDLLGRVAGFSGALRHGVSRMAIGGHQLVNGDCSVIDPALTVTAKEWVAQTPQPKRARVCGTLDMIRVSDRVFELLLHDGNRVRAVWTEPTVVHLKEFLDKRVLIEGEAVFRASGSLLRVEATAIAPAGEQDSFFSTVPLPAATVKPERLREAQTPTTGINAMWGKWPADEPEEELLRALEEMS